VFTYKRIGRSHAYRCNPDSIQYPIFADIFAKEEKIWLDMLEYLKDELTGIGTCILFGSFARSEENFDSDLDLLIVADDKKSAESRLSEISENILARFSVTVAPMIMNRQEFESKRRKGFIKQALSEGVVIVKDGTVN
jgi:predicted nucleotidyltransferase